MDTAIVVTIVLVGVVGQLYFLRGRDPAAKQRYFPWWIGVLSALFLIAPPLAGMPTELLLFWGPAVVFNGWFTIRVARFCARCGAMSMRASGQVRYCTRCGAELPPTRQG